VNTADESYDYAACTRQYDQLQSAREVIKAALMLAELDVPIPLVIDIFDQSSRIRHLCRQLKGAMHLLLDKLTRSSDARPCVRCVCNGIRRGASRG
jgi:hypothetical protein